MNPDTNELRLFDKNEVLPKGFISIPEGLRKAARLKLGKNRSATVSKTSGGKLSKWAAKKRKQREKQRKMVEACNNYYC